MTTRTPLIYLAWCLLLVIAFALTSCGTKPQQPDFSTIPSGVRKPLSVPRPDPTPVEATQARLRTEVRAVEAGTREVERKLADSRADVSRLRELVADAYAEAGEAARAGIERIQVVVIQTEKRLTETNEALAKTTDALMAADETIQTLESDMANLKTSLAVQNLALEERDQAIAEADSRVRAAEEKSTQNQKAYAQAEGQIATAKAGEKRAWGWFWKTLIGGVLLGGIGYVVGKVT